MRIGSGHSGISTASQEIVDILYQSNCVAHDLSVRAEESLTAADAINFADDEEAVLYFVLCTCRTSGYYTFYIIEPTRRTHSHDHIIVCVVLSTPINNDRDAIKQFLVTVSDASSQSVTGIIILHRRDQGHLLLPIPSHTVGVDIYMASMYSTPFTKSQHSNPLKVSLL